MNKKFSDYLKHIDYSKIVNCFKKSIKSFIIIITGIILLKVANESMLAIDTRKLIKTDVFKGRIDNNEYYNYMEVFESYILNGNYDEAYYMLDEYNAKEKFSNIDDFKEKISYIYSYEKFYEYNVEKIVQKEKYKDIYIKVYLSYKDVTNLETDIVEFMIREYETFNYKIYLRSIL